MKRDARALGATTLLLILAFCGCGYGSERRYQGEGRLTVLHRVPATTMKIDFPDFQFDRPLHATYRVAGLPPSNYSYSVGLAVEGPIGRFLPTGSNWPGSQASLRLRLLDAGGRPIVDCGGELYRFNWHSIEGDRPFSRARASSPDVPGVQCVSEFEVSGAQTPATLVVAYEPEPNSPAVPACVRITSTSWN
jgi:hypothetical protein